MAKKYAYNVGNKVIYEGEAHSLPDPVTLTVASVSKAAAAVLAVEAHGMETGYLVLISGATGDWDAMNGTKPITKVDADSFSVAVDSQLFAEDFDGTVQCLGPQTNADIWTIKAYEYDGSSNLIAEKYPNGKTTATFAWDDRASLNYQ